MIPTRSPGQLAPALALSLALAGVYAQDAKVQDANSQEKAPHGAMAFGKQQQLLSTLQPLAAGSVPKGVDANFWRVFVPEVDTPAQVALGQRLYFDPQLSKDGSVSCSTCHDVSRNFTDLRPVSEGIGGKLGRRNAPTVMNAALITPM
ncbi:MAG: cytochrome-c peroxidase, partial [Planctomycetota bacterium]